MKRLPIWMIAVTAVLAVLMTWVGLHEIDEAGVAPVVIGIVWIVFALACLGRAFAPESD